MRVSAWSDGIGGFGIRVSPKDRKHHFQEGWKTAEIKINGKYITCNLSDRFWDRCPEIRKIEFLEWFKTLDYVKMERGIWKRNWIHRKPPKFKLIPVSKSARRFILEEYEGM